MGRNNYDYAVIRINYASDEEYEDSVEIELEIRDNYVEANVFWVRAESRRQSLKI